jgi:gliding motility-associated-like protein
MAGKVFTLFLFLLLSLTGYSQCSDNLGVPVVNETFGSGSSEIGPALPAGITNLQYVHNTCPDDGQYSIVRYTSGCYASVWHTIKSDHTGNPDGYFMIVNATTLPNDFYVQTVNGLCSGTTYDFSAWVINMVQKDGFIEPNLSFVIESPDGAVLSNFGTGNVPVTNPLQWSKYSFFFTVPEGVSSVILKIRNDVFGGNGNDLGLDDISFTPIGPKAAVSTNGSALTEIEYPCQGPLSFTAKVEACYVQNAYQWQASTDDKNFTDIAGATSPTNTVTLTTLGTYYYRLCISDYGAIQSPYCRLYSDTIKVNYRPNVNVTTNKVTATTCQDAPYVMPSGKTVDVTGNYIDTLRAQGGCDSIYTDLDLTVLSSPLKPDLGPSKDLCLGDSLLLNPGSGYVSYLWQDGSKLPTYEAKSGGVYWVRVFDASGCFSADTVVVTEIYCSPIRPPTAFTPNGDGINDIWNIEGLQYFLGCTVMVYNRSGQLVFQSVGYSRPWDGKYGGRNLPVGTYYYVINLKNSSPSIAGSVTIIR